jgi:hypothetical protein
LGDNGALGLLQLAAATAILGLADLDADVVDDRGGLQDEQRVRVQSFAQADQPRKAVDLDEMLDAPRIAGVVWRSSPSTGR